MTLTDPVIYTKPWPASAKVWALIPKSKMSVGGWGGILEDRCVPSDEHLFNHSGIKLPERNNHIKRDSFALF